MGFCTEDGQKLAAAQDGSDSYEGMDAAEGSLENRDEGRFLQIVNFIQSDKGKPLMKLDKSTITSVISKAGNLPVAVFCTGGPRRQCSGVLLDYMVQRLEALEMGESSSDSIVSEMPRADRREFNLIEDYKPEASGMWIWSRPFIVKNKDNNEIAVLLMDTQGTYEDIESISAILTLSLLTSSVMVYSVLPDGLQEFATFFHNYANHEHLHGNSVIFQKLVFLIRDWTRPKEYPVGWEGGKRILKKWLQADKKPDKSPKAETTMCSLAQFFEKMDCFLLPDFGEQADLPYVCGSMNKLAPEWTKSVAEFVSGIITRDTLFTKGILGHEITARNLLSYLEKYIDIFNSEEKVTPQMLMEATRGARLSQLVYQTPLKLNQFIDGNLLSRQMKEDICSFFDRVNKDVAETQQKMDTCVEEGLEHYRKEMEKVLESQEFLPQEELEKAHENVQKLAVLQLRKFDKIPDNVVDYEKILKRRIQERFSKFKKENLEKETATRGKAQSGTQQCYKTYLKNMKNKMEDWHLKTAEFTRKKFLDQCPAKDVPRFVEEHERQLEELMNATQEKLNQALMDVVTTSAEQRQNEKAQSLMKECAEAAISEVGNVFPERIRFWIKNVLEPDSISEMKVIYSEALNGTVEKYRDIVSAKLWSDFVELVNLQCKEECLKSLEVITELLENMKECLHVGIQPLDEGSSVTPAELNEVAKTELQKITTDQHCKLSVSELEMVQLGFDRLLEFYETQACKKMAADKSTQLLNIYNGVMEEHLKKASPCSSEAFQKLHDELAETVVADFKQSCIVWNKTDVIAVNEQFLKVELQSFFECHRKINKEKLENRRALTDKIIGNLKKQYSEKMWKVLQENPHGLQISDLEMFHNGFYGEVVKLLEIEIRQKIGQDEPSDEYRKVLESTIDLYWLAIVSMNQENIDKRREEVEKEFVKTDILKMCSALESSGTYLYNGSMARKVSGLRKKAKDASVSLRELQDFSKTLKDIATARGVHV